MSHESAPLLNRGASARDADGGRSGDDLASDVRGGRGWGNRAWLLACGAAVVGATAIAGVSSSATLRRSASCESAQSPHKKKERCAACLLRSHPRAVIDERKAADGSTRCMSAGEQS